MIYTDSTKTAMKVCYEAHRDQVDKSGIPYVFHPFHVAEQMVTEATVIVALLHDVVEDTSMTLEDLQSMGFSEEVISALSLLTHQKDVPYMEYVAAIASNPVARAVKIADLKHNMDATRLNRVDEKTEQRMVKYRRALEMLTARNSGDVQ